MSTSLTWGELFIPKKKQLLCQHCQQQLEWTGKEICMYCSKPSLFQECYDCQRWKRVYLESDPLELNISVFTYNRFMKDFITKWKYRGDYQLGYVFREIFLEIFVKKVASLHQQMEIIPIPLSDERKFERAFNQAEMLASFLGKEWNTSLTRIQGEKQSKKSRQERMSSINPFNLKKSINNPVLLVDDIYTTGRTIRHAAELLKAHGCPNVYAYTLIRG